MEPGPHYHFDEVKPIRAAASTDSHYFRVAQYLRLVRRSLSVAGMQLLSVTPHGRLNDYFPYRPARHVLRSISQSIGDPTCEPVRGLYRQTEIRHSQRLGPMRDFLPHHWSSEERPQSPGGKVKLPATSPPGEIHIEAEGFIRRPLDEKLNRLPADFIDLDEDG